MAQKHQHLKCPQFISLFIINLTTHIFEFLIQSLISWWTLNEIFYEVLTIFKVPVRWLVPNLQTLKTHP